MDGEGKEPNNLTLLHFVIHPGSLEMTQVLLDQGVSLPHKPTEIPLDIKFLLRDFL